MSSQKLTFEKLKNHLWSAADILRGSLDANEYRQPIMTLLFLKRLNDQFEEKAEKLEKSGKSKKDAWEDPDRHAFFVPKEAKWKEITNIFENIGEKIDKVCGIIERANPDLEGVLTNISYNDKKRFPDDVLMELVSHFNKNRLRNFDLENEDIFGQAYEYLLEKFADSAGKSAGEFFTPREVVRLLVTLVEPKEGMKICDPTCGSGGMLIWSRKFIQKRGKNPKNLSLHGQERNFGNFGMCKMNMILHGIENFRIEHDNVLKNPLLVENGRLLTYDRVLANFPFSMDWNSSNASNDPYHRFDFGIPSKSYADFAFVQHIYKILNKNGRAAIIAPQGILFRGGKEEEIRKHLIDEDVIEGIVALPSNLFYGTGIPACVFLLNRNKDIQRKKKIFFIYAAKDFQEAGKRDLLRDKDIEKIVNSLRNYKENKKYCHVADEKEITLNKFNLNVPRYVDISEPDEEVDIQNTVDEIQDLEKNRDKIKDLITAELIELGFKL